MEVGVGAIRNMSTDQWLPCWLVMYPPVADDVCCGARLWCARRGILGHRDSRPIADGGIGSALTVPVAVSSSAVSVAHRQGPGGGLSEECVGASRYDSLFI